MLKSGQTPDNPLIGPGANDYGRKLSGDQLSFRNRYSLKSEFLSRKDTSGFPDTSLEEESGKSTENIKESEEILNRRVRLDLITPAELSIYNAIQSVEQVGVHEYLTEAVILLNRAQNCVADYVEEVERPKGFTPSFSISTLVSFGNYLLDRYGVMVYSTDGKNEPLYKREVTDADIQNYFSLQGLVDSRLPSAHQIGAKVELRFGETIVKGCRIIKVHFTESKVLYDVDVTVVTEYSKGDSLSYSTRLYNIESDFVIPAS